MSPFIYAVTDTASPIVHINTLLILDLPDRSLLLNNLSYGPLRFAGREQGMRETMTVMR